jgi:UDP-N-acetylglucosamine--N-acetylmuramyl-(pentapeptide) pyrophosphoryl-undecaprenol N-acetylglucosamine transferase
MKVLLVCERSGGHVFPALAFAGNFLDRGIDRRDMTFFVTGSKFSEQIVKEGFAVVGKSFESRNLLLEMVWRFFEAWGILNRVRPDLVVGFGGRDSIFLLIIAALFGKKTVIYEPNLTFGKANGFLRGFVGKVLTGTKVGVPLRRNLTRLNKSEVRAKLGLVQDKPVVLCFGGSQGASFINRVFLKTASKSGQDYQVIHLTGEREYVAISQGYNTIKINSLVKDFYYSMEELYSAADILVCRSGASSLAEAAFYGLPGVLIPHPAAGGHQKDNARYFKDKKAAVVFTEDGFSQEEFDRAVSSLVNDEKLRADMAANMAKTKFGVPYEAFVKSDLGF